MPARSDQKSLEGTLREHLRRIRVLEARAASIPTGGPFFNWIPIADLSISSAGVPPTLAFFNGDYMNIPSPGTGPTPTVTTFMTLSLKIATVGTPTSPMTLNTLQTAPPYEIELYGYGIVSLKHTEPDGTEILYGGYISTPGMITFPGVDPGGRGFYYMGEWRKDYPCVLAVNDTMDINWWGINVISDGL